MLTTNRLKELLHYCPETGVFVRLVTVSHNARVGDIAGFNRPDGYIEICIDGNKYRAHRLAWLYMHGEWPDREIDHINRNRPDNRIANLRLATHRQNTRNRSISCNNTSGVTGVHLHKPTNQWTAKIKINGDERRLGDHADFFEACCARKSAENKIFGLFSPSKGGE